VVSTLGDVTEYDVEIGALPPAGVVPPVAEEVAVIGNPLVALHVPVLAAKS
jgi:hypothetical protein